MTFCDRLRAFLRSRRGPARPPNVAVHVRFLDEEGRLRMGTQVFRPYWDARGHWACAATHWAEGCTRGGFLFEGRHVPANRVQGCTLVTLK